MKKILSIAVAIIAFAAAANAQPRTIGVRVGGEDGISYQHGLGSGFLEFDANWNLQYGHIFATALYDIMLASEGNFNFYVGPGVTAGVWGGSNANDGNKGGVALAIAGQLGMEYNFGIPLTLSLDWTPRFGFIPSTGFWWDGIALGIRYRF